RHTRLQGDWSSDVCSSDLASAGEQRLDLRSEEQRAIGHRPVERFDAEPIAHEQQAALRRIPQCERKHAAEAPHAVIAPLFVGMQDRKSTRLNSSHLVISYA